MRTSNRLVIAFAVAALGSVIGLKVYDALGRRSAGPLASSSLAPIVRGDPAPEITAQARDGKPVSLETFHGRLLVLSFWFTDCDGCREEMPSLDVLAKRFAGQGVEVVALSVDDGWPKLDAFFQGESYFQGKPPAFRLVLDRQKRTPPRYGTFKYPETFIVGRDGRLLARFVGARDWSKPDAFRLVDALAR